MAATTQNKTQPEPEVDPKLSADELPEGVSAADVLPADDQEDDAGEPVADEISGDEGEEADADDGSGVDAELSQLAGQYGLDPSAFGNNRQNLEAAVGRIRTAEDRRLIELAQQWQQQQQPQQAYQPQGYQPQGYAPQQGYQQQPPPAQSQGQLPAYQPPFGQQAQQPQGFQPLDLDKLLPPDQYDDGVRSAFKALNDHYAAQFGPVQQFSQVLPVLQQRVEQVEQYARAQSEAKFWNEFDSFFDSLEPEKQAIFGKGPSAALPNHSPQRAAREKLLQQMDALSLAEAQMGRPFTPVSQIAQRAFAVAFAPELETIQRKKLTAQLKGRSGQSLARPTSKNGKPLDGMAAAIRASKQFDRKTGLV